MKYVIYIDVFFCVNLVMDFVIIKLASLYIKPQTTYIRCFLGAIVGSILTVISILIPYENMILHMLYTYIFIAIAIVVVTYGTTKIKYLIKNCLVIYVTTIFMGGLISFLYSYTCFGYVIHNVINGAFQGINILWLLGTTLFSYICIKGLMSFIKNTNKRNMLMLVRLTMGEKIKDVVALVDSGNSLMDPYTGKPVHIICTESILDMLAEMDVYKCNYRYVPFHSIGKKNGLLKTIEFDKLQVFHLENANGEIGELSYMEERAIIGLYEGVLSRNGEFEMILHRNVN